MPILKFPNWIDVLDGLFNSETFRSAGFDRDSLRHFNEQVSNLRKKYIFPLKEPDMMVQSLESSSQRKLSLSTLSEKDVLDQYDKQIIERNQFTLIGDAHTMSFVRVNSKVIELLDLPSSEDFQLTRICGLDDKYELYHPEDVIHIIRHGLVALLTVSVKGMITNPFTDYYKVVFRTGFESANRFKTIERTCKLSNKAKDETGTRHFDIWTIEPGHDDFVNVRASVEILSDERINVCAKAIFYLTNCILLDINPRDAILANYLNKYGYRYFREELNTNSNLYIPHLNDPIDSTAATNMKSNLIKKINSRIVMNTKTQKYKSSIQRRSLHFKCGQLGILNMPSFLEERIWKRVEY
jgi:hypothetical protein